MIRRPPRPPLFPYTTLFRSLKASIKGRVSRITSPAQICLSASANWLEGTSVKKPSPPALMPKIGVREPAVSRVRSEEHTSELQSPCNLVCRLLLEKKQEAISAAGRTRAATPDRVLPASQAALRAFAPAAAAGRYVARA